jgi:hypothetical protein
MDTGMSPVRETVRVNFLYCLLLLLAMIIFCGCIQDNAGLVMVSPANESGFDMKMAGPHFTIYFHSGDDADAAAVLGILEQVGDPLYTKYFGTEPFGIPVYLATGADEYFSISGYPGEKGSVTSGAVSINSGRIYLYQPARSTRVCRRENPLISRGVQSAISSLYLPYPETQSCPDTLLNKRGIIWGGASASVTQYLVPDNAEYLPRFLREGMAQYIVYVSMKGSTFNTGDPAGPALSRIAPATDGRPELMTVDQLERRCSGYSNGQLDALCREESAYVIGYINKEYGKETMISFLSELKKTHNWKTALQNVTGKDTGELWRDIIQSRSPPLPS